MRTAAFIINKLPQPRLEFVSPFEKLWNMKPTVSYFRVFGCVCYVFVPNHLRSKFDKKAVRCIFVGYDSQRKGWKCCDPTSGRCYTSRDMVFDEASSWWSSEKEVLPDSREFRDKLQQKMGSILFNSNQVQMNQEIQMAMMLNKEWLRVLGKLACINNQTKKVGLLKQKNQLHNLNSEGQQEHEGQIPNTPMQP